MFEFISYSLTRIALLALALFAAGASAGAPEVSFSGFGTLGVVHSSEHQADFTSSIFKPNGAGYSHAWSADVDSLIGGQVTAHFTPKFSAVLQVISAQNYDNTYRPHVEWAYIQYQLTPDFSIRAGRTLLPTFMFSETRQVSYTYPWVRVPLEFYRLEPTTTIDGVDARYQTSIGDTTNILQGYYGKSDNRLPNNAGKVKGRQSWGLAYTVEYHTTTVHISYETSQLTIDGFKPIFDAFRQFGPEGIALANKYEIDNNHFSVITIGASYDPGQWFVMGEAGQLVTHSVFGKGTGWYLSGGYRLGKITPYLTYGQAKADNLSDPGLTLSTLPPPLVGPAAGLNAGLNSLLSAKPVQTTLSIGARWDFANNAALKLQYDHTRIGTGSSGVLSNLQPGFQPGGTVNMFSAAIDFVF